MNALLLLLPSFWASGTVGYKRRYHGIGFLFTGQGAHYTAICTKFTKLPVPCAIYSSQVDVILEEVGDVICRADVKPLVVPIVLMLLGTVGGGFREECETAMVGHCQRCWLR